MAEAKTKPTKASVSAFLAKVAGDTRRKDCATLVQLMKQATACAPTMWGTSIVGFGTHGYVGASGRSTDWPVIGFSPRKNDLTLYIMPGVDRYGALLGKLGKHKTGKACLYIKRLADVDRAVLKELIAVSVRDLKQKQLAAFIAKYEPAVAKLARSTRAALRKRLPTAIELVYDNYQFLAIGFAATERASDCLVSLAVSPKGVALSFYYGASLPDPAGILLGSGNQNRFVRLSSAAALKAPAVEGVIRAAIAQAKTPLPKTGRGALVIKSVSAKQRPRRKETK